MPNVLDRNLTKFFGTYSVDIPYQKIESRHQNTYLVIYERVMLSHCRNDQSLDIPEEAVRGTAIGLSTAKQHSHEAHEKWRNGRPWRYWAGGMAGCCRTNFMCYVATQSNR